VQFVLLHVVVTPSGVRGTVAELRNGAVFLLADIRNVEF
jgi:hypothetical protein